MHVHTGRNKTCPKGFNTPCGNKFKLSKFGLDLWLFGPKINWVHHQAIGNKVWSTIIVSQKGIELLCRCYAKFKHKIWPLPFWPQNQKGSSSGQSLKCEVWWWFVCPDTFVLGRYFWINEFSGLLNRQLVRTWKSVPTLFVRTSKISRTIGARINESSLCCYCDQKLIELLCGNIAKFEV